MIELIKSSTFKQFIRFCLVGLVNTIIDFSVYISLTRLWEFWSKNYLIANALAFIAANIFSFLVNKSWTFNNRGYQRVHSQYLKFLIVSLVALVIVEVTLYSLVEYLDIYDLGAKVVGILLSLIWSFLSHRYWTFKN